MIDVLTLDKRQDIQVIEGTGALQGRTEMQDHTWLENELDRSVVKGYKWWGEVKLI